MVRVLKLLSFLILLFLSTNIINPRTAAAATEILLKPGTRGRLVSIVQNYLHQLYYLKPKATGYYGKMTREAVKSFQLEHGLTATGVTDGATFNAIQQAYWQRNSYTEYTVKPGENLVDIAVRFNTSPAVIMVKNKLTGNEVFPGQKLIIPAMSNGGPRTGISRGRSGVVQNVPWSIVNQLWKRGEVARIIDIDTGHSFQVKRLYGYYHADVEPLTKYDTQTMKKIYGGHWSWKRRAVIIRFYNLYLAASINGMPHGGQSIYDNNFPGQFCAHFLGSRIHKDGRVDPEHQAMINKAVTTMLPLETEAISSSAERTNPESGPAAEDTIN